MSDERRPTPEANKRFTPPKVVPSDDVISISARGFRVRANDMRALAKATGLTLGELLESDDMADQTQAMAFLQLRRRHPDDDPGELWEHAGDTEIEFEDEAPKPDPTSAPPS